MVNAKYVASSQQGASRDHNSPMSFFLLEVEALPKASQRATLHHLMHHAAADLALPSHDFLVTSLQRAGALPAKAATTPSAS